MIVTPVKTTNLDLAMRLLVTIADRPQCSHDLAEALGTSRATVVRLVETLRALGCRVDAVREGKHDWAYHLGGWGVFAPDRVRRHLRGLRG